MQQQILKELKDSLNSMEETGKVDLSILDKLNNLRDLAENIQTKWAENPNPDGFYFYHAAKNVELVLNGMMDRFKKSHEANDNPQIATDSLKLLPALERALEIADTDEITPQTINIASDRADQLHDVAIETNLNKALAQSRDSVDIEFIRPKFNKIIEYLDTH